jgi:hypothetical protein
VQHKADGQQARDELQQQRSGRPEGRAQHGRASERARQRRIASGESIYLSLSYLLSIYLILSIYQSTARALTIFSPLFPTRREIVLPK